MKVQFVGNCPPRLYFQSVGNTRFLALLSEEKEIIINIYQIDKLHLELFREESQNNSVSFLAGGYCSPYNQEFDSSSCKEVFGFDRPEDPLLQEEILKAIKDFFKNL